MGQENLMSVDEAQRYQIIKRVLDGEIKQSTAAAQLQLSVRQIKRLCRSVCKLGAGALISKKRGQPSRRRVAQDEQKRVIDLVREHYSDFGPQLASEYLRRDHSLTTSVETLRQWMIQGDLWKPKQRRDKRVHSPRPRRPRFGELVQIDGSHHDWFEDITWLTDSHIQQYSRRRRRRNGRWVHGRCCRCFRNRCHGSRRFVTSTASTTCDQ